MNPEFHSCRSCGYTWRHGQHGGHSCTQYLQEMLSVYKGVADRAFNWNRVQGPTETYELHAAVERMKEWEAKRNEKTEINVPDDLLRVDSTRV